MCFPVLKEKMERMMDGENIQDANKTINLGTDEDPENSHATDDLRGSEAVCNLHSDLIRHRAGLFIG